MKKILPKLEKGIYYITSDPKRWDKERGLVKRPLSIDTWDFTHLPDAGELAKAAFHHGYEEYGWDIIQRFMKLVKRDGTSYFLYNPDSTPQPHGGPSAWGAAALLSAIDEGLAGIQDMGVNYDEILFSPKFPVTHYQV